MTETTPKRTYRIPQGYCGMKYVMELFGCCYSSIQLMVADGRLPQPHKHGKVNVWEKKVIDTWYKNGKFLK